MGDSLCKTGNYLIQYLEVVFKGFAAAAGIVDHDKERQDDPKRDQEQNAAQGEENVQRTFDYEIHETSVDFCAQILALYRIS